VTNLINDYKLLRQIVILRRYSILTVLEVGTLVGYSAILMGTNLPEDGHIHSVEINSHSAELALANIRRAHLENKIEVHTGNALEVIPGLNATFDMAFIDAAKEEYLR
jgi:caffeoyl-CoA O-methyltransferase